MVVTIFNLYTFFFCMFQRRCVKLCTNKVADSLVELVSFFVQKP